MNVFIGLLLTSWAHHSNKHISDKNSIYDSLDNYMCYVAISITLLYALLYSSSLQIMLYICIFNLSICRIKYKLL